MQKAVIYTRVSTGQQAEDGTGLEVQEAACLRKAQELGAEVVDVISDEGVSGAFYLSRPGIQRALTMLEAGKATLLITMKLDRTGRDVDIVRLIQKRVMNAGGRLVFADGMNFENNATGRLMLTQLAGFAEYEKEVIRERTMGGRRRRAEQGQQPSRTQSPFGYRIVLKENVLRGEYPPESLGTYQIIPEQAAIVREIFARYARGASFRKIAQWMEEQNFDTQRGGKCWHTSTVHYLISNPVYKGEPAFGRQQWRMDESRIKEGFKPAYARRVPKSEWVTLECEPLVSKEIWDLCQARMAENRKTQSSRQKRRYMLTGLILCPACGRLMASENTKGILYYRCVQSRPSRSVSRTVCTKTPHRGDVVEGIILRDIGFLSEQPERFTSALRTYTRKTERAAEAPEEANRLRAELADLDVQEMSTAKAQVDAFIKGRSSEVYDRMLAEIDTRRKAIKARLSVLDPMLLEPLVDLKTEGERIAEVLRRVVEVLSAEEITPAKKRELLGTIIKVIRPEGDCYLIELHASPHLFRSGERVQRIEIICMENSRWGASGNERNSTEQPSPSHGGNRLA